MTARARRPTDERADGYPPERRPAVLHAAPAAAPESWEHDATRVAAPSAALLEQATPTLGDAKPPEAEGATELGAGKAASEPILVISMKQRSDGGAPPRDPEQARPPLHAQLRSLAEAAGVHESPAGLGRLAPPHDPDQARARRRRDNLRWAFVVIALACAIAAAIWLFAGR